MALIYIVEDDRNIREIETIALSNSGHIIQSFETAKEFYKILTEPKNAVTLQYQELLKVDNINLTFKEEALKEIARYAEEENETSENLGARRLHTVLELLLEDISFNASGDHPVIEVVIDKEYVTKAFANFNKEHDLRKYVL